jgi:hypothetical protein
MHIVELALGYHIASRKNGARRPKRIQDMIMRFFGLNPAFLSSELHIISTH